MSWLDNHSKVWLDNRSSRVWLDNRCSKVAVHWTGQGRGGTSPGKEWGVTTLFWGRLVNVQATR